MSTYSCAGCGSTSTVAGTCCGKPMGPYSQVNAAALAKAAATPRRTR